MANERRDGKTPNGGDYSEIFYLDDKHNLVEPEHATQCIIRECKSDGTLIMETFGLVKPKKRSFLDKLRRVK